MAKAPDIDKLSKMSALCFGDKDKAELEHDLGKINDWLQQLQEVDTTDADPLFTMSTEVNHLSEDVPEPPLSLQEVFVNAPQHDHAYFHLPAKKNV